MFNSQKKPFDVFKCTYQKNDYNEEISTFVFYKRVEMFISLLQHNQFTANNVILMKCNYIALTDDKTLEKGMVIDNRYTIEFINSFGREIILYLKEVTE